MTTEKMTEKAARYLIVVYRDEYTADGLPRSAIHAKFGARTWEEALKMLAKAAKMKKADPDLHINLNRC